LTPCHLVTLQFTYLVWMCKHNDMDTYINLPFIGYVPCNIYLFLELNFFIKSKTVWYGN
jgi:hypothetical protein